MRLFQDKEFLKYFLIFSVLNLILVDGTLTGLIFIVDDKTGYCDSTIFQWVSFIYIILAVTSKFLLLPILFWLAQKYVKNENVKNYVSKFRQSFLLKIVVLPLVYCVSYIWSMLAITIFFPYSIGEGYNFREIYSFSSTIDDLFGLYQSYILLYICWFVVDICKFILKISIKLLNHFNRHHM